MTYLMIESSLNADTSIKSFPCVDDAIEAGTRRLAAEGWPIAEAKRQLADGRECLVADDGDDWTITVRAA